MTWVRRGFSVVMLGAIIGATATVPRLGAEEAASTDPPPVRVGLMIYDADKHPKCFGAGFLNMVAWQSSIRVERKLVKVGLPNQALFDFPFVIMAGEDKLELTAHQIKWLRAYVTRGGFVLASAGCSSKPWAKSFLEVMAKAFPRHKLKPLPMKHPIFHSLFEIKELRSERADVDHKLFGLTLGDRLAVVFSPIGLNDTDNAEEGCCCCGGNELRDAHLLNANILAYVLTHD